MTFRADKPAQWTEAIDAKPKNLSFTPQNPDGVIEELPGKLGFPLLDFQ